jgi:glycosyltransferase involved in cell wall biosynthesis
MCRLLGTAAAVVMNTPEAARAVRGLQEIRDVVVTAIPNGFEPSDFGGAAAERTDDAFRIVHTGYLHTELGSSHRAVATIRRLLGGTLGSVDLLTRSHVYLLEAVRSIRERDPELGRRIEVHLAGVTSEADRAAANLSGIRLHDYLSHDRAVALMRGADLLFLPMHDLPPTVRSRIVPGKTYEYLASGRPILAAVPDGDARDLVASGTGHWLCRPADVEAIAAAIAEQARLAAVGAPDPGPPPGFDRYSREALTSRLADLLERVTAAGAAARSVALPRTIGPA